MSDGNFFDDVFEDPDEDPLLGGEGASSEASSASPESRGAPSWMDEENAESREEKTDREARTKKIVVDQRAGHGQDLDELNRAVKQGWEVVRLSYQRPGTTTGGAGTEGRRQFVAVLEQDGPQSLFDFGPEA